MWLWHWDFWKHAICAIRILDTGEVYSWETNPSSSKMMLHNNCDRKDSVAEKKSLIVIAKGLGAKTNNWRYITNRNKILSV
jgi:hypothetical protein